MPTYPVLSRHVTLPMGAQGGPQDAVVIGLAPGVRRGLYIVSIHLSTATTRTVFTSSAPRSATLPWLTWMMSWLSPLGLKPAVRGPTRAPATVVGRAGAWRCHDESVPSSSFHNCGNEGWLGYYKMHRVDLGYPPRWQAGTRLFAADVRVRNSASARCRPYIAAPLDPCQGSNLAVTTALAAVLAPQSAAGYRCDMDPWCPAILKESGYEAEVCLTQQQI